MCFLDARPQTSEETGSGKNATLIRRQHYLAAHGLPVVPLGVLFSYRAFLGAHEVLAGTADLIGFLRDPSAYPLFGKPAEGFQSLGTVCLLRYFADKDTVETASGHLISVTDFAQGISEVYSDGYIFQKLIRPHAAMKRVCG